MNVPIFGTDYKIFFVDPVDDKDGDCCFEKKIIRVHPELDQENREKTLLHELGHAIIFETGLYQVLHPDIIEIIVDNFSVFHWKTFFIKFKLPPNS